MLWFIAIVEVLEGFGNIFFALNYQITFCDFTNLQILEMSIFLTVFRSKLLPLMLIFRRLKCLWYKSLELKNQLWSTHLGLEKLFGRANKFGDFYKKLIFFLHKKMFWHLGNEKQISQI